MVYTGHVGGPSYMAPPRRRTDTCSGVVELTLFSFLGRREARIVSGLVAKFPPYQSLGPRFVASLVKMLLGGKAARRRAFREKFGHLVWCPHPFGSILLLQVRWLLWSGRGFDEPAFAGTRGGIASCGEGGGSPPAAPIHPIRLNSMRGSPHEDASPDRRRGRHGRRVHPSAQSAVTLYGRLNLDTELQRGPPARADAWSTTVRASACVALKTWVAA